tara:strand:- start:277 stop:678 length:402 start_codon:yes stop_codon:yes gene_type:complete
LISQRKIPIDNTPFLVYIINIEREKYIMKKVILLLALLWFGLVSFQNSVKANDYTTAVIGHVIQNHKDIDHSKLLEAELKKMMHSMSIEMVSLLQKHLPYIMDGVMTELKLELDKTHKCLLLKDSKIKDKDCK